MQERLERIAEAEKAAQRVVSRRKSFQAEEGASEAEKRAEKYTRLYRETLEQVADAKASAQYFEKMYEKERKKTVSLNETIAKLQSDLRTARAAAEVTVPSMGAALAAPIPRQGRVTGSIQDATRISVPHNKAERMVGRSSSTTEAQGRTQKDDWGEVSEEGSWSSYGDSDLEEGEDTLGDLQPSKSPAKARSPSLAPALKLDLKKLKRDAPYSPKSGETKNSPQLQSGRKPSMRGAFLETIAAPLATPRVFGHSMGESIFYGSRVLLRIMVSRLLTLMTLTRFSH